MVLLRHLTNQCCVMYPCKRSDVIPLFAGPICCCSSGVLAPSNEVALTSRREVMSSRNHSRIPKKQLLLPSSSFIVVIVIVIFQRSEVMKQNWLLVLRQIVVLSFETDILSRERNASHSCFSKSNVKMNFQYQTHLLWLRNHMCLNECQTKSTDQSFVLPFSCWSLSFNVHHNGVL